MQTVFMTTSPKSPRKIAAVSVALSMVFVAGCGKAAEKVAEKATEEAIENEVGGDADVDLNPDGGMKIETEDGSYSADGEGNVNIETEDGSYSSSAELPEGWPEDVPVPAGLKIQMGSSADTPQGLMLTVNGTVTTAPDKVMADLKKELSGWEMTQESVIDQAGTKMANANWTLDGREVVLSATDMGDGTVQVMVAHTAPTE